MGYKSIDTRDLQETLNELETSRDDFIAEKQEEFEAQQEAAEAEAAEAQEEFEADEMPDYAAMWAAENPDEAAELEALTDLADEIGDEFRHGVQLIRESDFTEFAQEFADEIGAVDRDASWPYTCIDWDKAAEELQQDYSSCEYDGTDYLYRA